jgi:hypothetical protein
MWFCEKTMHGVIIKTETKLVLKIFIARFNFEKLGFKWRREEDFALSGSKNLTDSVDSLVVI